MKHSPCCSSLHILSRPPSNTKELPACSKSAAKLVKHSTILLQSLIINNYKTINSQRIDSTAAQVTMATWQPKRKKMLGTIHSLKYFLDATVVVILCSLLSHTVSKHRSSPSHIFISTGVSHRRLGNNVLMRSSVPSCSAGAPREASLINIRVNAICINQKLWWIFLVKHACILFQRNQIFIQMVCSWNSAIVNASLSGGKRDID